MDILQKLKIQVLQDKVYDEFNQNILNILNGQMMYDEFYNQNLFLKGDYVPFNEAMCSNHACNIIFSNEFNLLRASGHLDKSQDELLKSLYKTLPMYGLGDIQYLKIIDTIEKGK